MLIIRILFLAILFYFLYTLVKVFFFVKDSLKFDKKNDGEKLNERKPFENRFNRKNIKTIELDKDQYKVE